MKKLIPLILFSLTTLSILSASTNECQLLEFAVQNNDSELAEILIKYGGDKTFPTLNKAMEARDYYAVQLLIEYGVNINSRAEAYMEDFIERKSYKIIQGRTVLEMAIDIRNFNLIEYFLIKSADPTNQRICDQYVFYGSSWHKENASYITTAVYNAILFGRLDLLKMYYNHGINLNTLCYKIHYSSKPSFSLTYSPIEVAISCKQKECIEFLLSIGVKV